MQTDFSPMDELNNCHKCVQVCIEVLADPVFKLEDNEKIKTKVKEFEVSSKKLELFMIKQLSKPPDIRVEIEELKEDLKKKDELIATYQNLIDNWTGRFKDILEEQKSLILDLNYEATEIDLTGEVEMK
jgi:hypothetical protein